MKVSAIEAIRIVFSKPSYSLLFLFISAALFFIAVLTPNFSLISRVWQSENVNFETKAKLVFQLLGGIRTNFHFFSAVSTSLSALLFGVNVAMTVFYLKRKRSIKKSFLGTISGGFAAGLMGVGCAICGSLFLSAFLPVLGLGGILSFLPLGGGEFGILGVILLFVSLVIISKQIADENICKI